MYAVDRRRSIRLLHHRQRIFFPRQIYQYEKEIEKEIERRKRQRGNKFERKERE